MEWQNTFFKAAQNRMQFIPIRLDSSIMPALLTPSLYIDLFSKGLDVAIRQIVDVIKGNNTYREPINKFSNLVAYKYRDGDKLTIECHAEHFLEPISSFAFCTQQDTQTISADLRNESMCTQSQMNAVTLGNGYKTNIIFREISKGTIPGLPFVVEFKSNTNSPFDIEAVMHKKIHDEFQEIPLINKPKYL